MAAIHCPECGGSTEVWRVIDAVMRLIRCPYCKGTGNVEWEE